MKPLGFEYKRERQESQKKTDTVTGQRHTDRELCTKGQWCLSVTWRINSSQLAHLKMYDSVSFMLLKESLINEPRYIDLEK